VTTNRTNLRQLVSQSSLYVAGNVLRRGFSLVTMPVFTRSLGPAGYGVLAIVGALQSALEVLFELGMATAATRFYYECKGEEDKRRLFGTLLIVSGALAIGQTILLFAIGPWLWPLVSDDVPFFPYVALTIGTVLTGTIGVLPRVLFRVENRVPTFFRLSLIQTGTMVALAITLVLVAGFGPGGPIGATFVVSVLFAGVYAWHLRGRVAGVVDWAMARRSLAFGLPDIPMHMGTWVLKAADRLILQHFTSLAVVGVYSVGVAISKMPFDLVANGIHWAIVPFFYATTKYEAESSAKASLARVATYNVAVLAGLGLATVLFAPELVEILASTRYADAIGVIPLCVGASFFQALTYIPSKSIYLKEKTWSLPLIVATGAGVNLGLNFVLIPAFGLMGAAWASFIGQVVTFAVLFAVSQAVYAIPYEYGRTLKVVLAAGVVVIVGGLSPDASLISRLALKSLAVIGFPALLWQLGFFDHQEIRWIRRRVAATVSGRV
jgi:O-antigen/teichoic acid export membrane protein